MIDALPPHSAFSPRGRRRTWLFDLDDTLHDASRASFPQAAAAMRDYIAEHLGLSPEAATALRQRYWQRYGATLLGLVRHHGVRAAHFLEQTHRMPGLEQRLRCHPADRAALRRLPGRKVLLTNAPRAYAWRVLNALRLADCFDAVIAIEDMTVFGQLRPKPDARMLRHVLARLRLVPARCVLVEDTLEHQRAARRVGMKTVWMQRYLRTGPVLATTPAGPGERFAPHVARSAPGRPRTGKPAYVDARVASLRRLALLWGAR